MDQRLKEINLIIYLGFVALFLGLGHVQVMQFSHYRVLSDENRIRLVPLIAQRGSIYDRNGIKLAGNRLSFNLSIIPSEVNNLDKTIDELSRFTGIASKVLKSGLTGKENSVLPVALARDLEREKAFIIEEKKYNLPGVLVEAVPMRTYYYPKAASHLTGYLSEIDEESLERLKGYGYQLRDKIGRTGVEKYYDVYLRGKSGGRQLEVTNRGEIVREITQQDSVPGEDIHLSIDIELQSFLYELLNDAPGAVCVMNPVNGEVWALVSSPGFDPNIFTNPRRRSEIKNIFNDPDLPLLNRAISGEYPPGSTFKLVTAAAGLDGGVVNKNEEFQCNGSFELGRGSFNCWRLSGHGPMDLLHAIKYSCNVYFFNTSRKIGIDCLSPWAKKFGFGRLSNIDLPGELSGFVPSRKWKKRDRKEIWYEGDTLNFSIGQGYLLATPLQVVRLISSFANNGYLVDPYVLSKIADYKVGEFGFEAVGMKESTRKTIRDGIHQVVQGQHATGQNARVKGIESAGKTGTAQAPPGRSHAWYMGMVPYEDSKFSFVIFLEHGGQGGGQPAIIASKLIRYLMIKELL